MENELETISERSLHTGVNSELVGRIYRDLAWFNLPNLLNEVSTLLESEDIAIYTAPDKSNCFTSVVSGAISNDVHQDYLNQYQQFDKQILRLLDSEERNYLTGCDLTTPDEQESCPVHNDYLAPNKIDSQLVYVMRGELGHRRTFVAMRDSRVGNYQPRQIDLFRNIAQHFKSSFDLHDSLNDFRNQSLLSKEIQKDMSLGIAVLSDSFLVLRANEIFSDFVSRTDFFNLTGDILTGNGSYQPKWQQLLGNALNGEAGHMRLASSDQRAKISVFPYSKPPQDLTICAPEGRILVVLREQQARIKFDAATIKNLLRITPAESRLAAHLANGGGVGGFVEDWHVSKHTVRNQLKSIYGKTGIRSQKDLVARIYELTVDRW